MMLEALVLDVNLLLFLGTVRTFLAFRVLAGMFYELGSVFVDVETVDAASVWAVVAVALLDLGVSERLVFVSLR